MTNRHKLSLLAVALSGGLLLAAAQGTTGKWVPFSAHYNETVSSKDASGNVMHKRLVSDEKRSEDGAMMMVESQGGQAVSGKIWQANGKMIDLDYGRQQAFTAGQSTRRHLGTRGGSPTGAATIAGLSCAVYPVHMAKGGGTICVDVADDIVAKEELHFEAGGMHQDYVKELTSIDLATSVDSSEFKIPEGFKQIIAAPSGPRSR